MAYTTINEGDSGLVARTAINNNFGLTLPYTGAATNVDLNAKSLKNFFISKTSDVTAKFVFDVSSLSTATIRTITIPDRSLTIDNITTATTSVITGLLKGASGTVDAAVGGIDYEFPLTFSTGLTRSTNTITSNISTGKSGGQTIYGGTNSNENITITSTSNASKGKIYIGSSLITYYDESSQLFNLGDNTLGGNLKINSILGSEIFTNFTTSNWTLTSGWDNTNGGSGGININHNANGTTTATLNTITPTIGITYKIVIVMSANTTGSFTYTFGGVTGSTLSSVTTYTDYITAATTGGLIFTPTNTSRATINSISIKAYSNTTNGTFTTYGDVFLNKIKSLNGNTAITISPVGGVGIPVIDSAISVTGNITSTGAIIAPNIIPNASSVNRPVWSNSGVLLLNPANTIGWSATTNVGSSSDDLEIGRSAAGILGVYTTFQSSGVGSILAGNYSSPGTAPWIYGINRNTLTDTIGNNLTIQAGSATLSASNKSGGDLILQTGVSTGIGTANIIFKTTTNTAGTNSDNTLTEKLRVTTNGIQVSGSVGFAYTAVTNTYSISATDWTVDCTSGTFTVTLPTAVGISSRIYNIINSGSGIITVATTSSQTIGNISPATTWTLNPGEVLNVQSNNSNWKLYA